MRRPNREDEFFFGEMPERIDLNTPHVLQRQILDALQDPDITYIVLCAGRRVGKSSVMGDTSPAIVDAAVYDGDRVGVFTPVAVDAKPVYDAIKRNYKPFCTSSNDIERYFNYQSGGFVKFWSLPNKGKQDNGRGDNYRLTIYDEIQKFNDDVIRHHVKSVAMPWMADTAGSKMLFVGTASGRRTFFHELAQRGVANGLKRRTIHAGNVDDLLENGKPLSGYNGWLTIRMPSEANPHLHAETLAALRKEVDDLTARQEFDCYFVEIGGKLWCYAANDDVIQRRVYVDTLDVNWRERIYLSFDFNKNPMSCVLMQFPALRTVNRTWKRGVHWIREFTTPAGEKSSIYDLIREIQHWIYGETGKRVGVWEGKRHAFPFPVSITGDATGRAGDGRQRTSRGYFEIICDELGVSRQTGLRLETTNPPHAESYVQINTLFQKNENFRISRRGCPLLCDDIVKTVADNYKGIDKKKYDPHKLDAARYGVNTFRREISNVFR